MSKATVEVSGECGWATLTRPVTVERAIAIANRSAANNTQTGRAFRVVTGGKVVYTPTREGYGIRKPDGMAMRCSDGTVWRTYSEADALQVAQEANEYLEARQH